MPPVVLTGVQSVAKRLSRIEDLLIEMRHEQDVELKRLNALCEKGKTTRKGDQPYGATGVSYMVNLPNGRKGARGKPAEIRAHVCDLMCAHLSVLNTSTG